MCRRTGDRLPVGGGAVTRAPNVEMMRALRLVWATVGHTERETPGAVYADFVADLAGAVVAELPQEHPLRAALQSCG